MLALFLFLAFGLVFGYFATLNTSVASVSFGFTQVDSVPMYVVILLSLGVGVVVSSLFYILKSVSDRMLVGKKEKEIEEMGKHNAELLKRVHKLELENTRLKTKTGEDIQDDDSL
jgi:uncharacterized integral membrane protein